LESTVESNKKRKAIYQVTGMQHVKDH